MLMNDGSVSRRTFVKGAAVVAGGGAALGTMPEVLAQDMATRRLKVGLIGCGGRGTGAAVQAISADNNVVLWSMGDAFADRLKSSHGHIAAQMAERDEEEDSPVWAAKVDVPESRRHVGFDAYANVIAECDVVLLCTPPVFRPMHLAAAVNAGRHVFCEKPVAVDAPGVRSVIDSAAKAKRQRLSLVSGFCWRYNAAERATMQQINDGAIGDIRAIYSTYNTSGFPEPKARQPEWSDMEFQLRNWHYFHPLSGDHIVEQACHAVDWLAWVMGDQPPMHCVAVGGRQSRPDTPETGNIFDHFSVTWDYPDQVRAFHMCRHFPNAAHDNTALFMGSKGTCRMEPWTPKHTITGESDWRYTGPQTNMYQEEHNELFQSIRDGKPMNDGQWMARSTMMAIMGRMAAYTGKQVTWEEAMESEASITPGKWTWGDVAMPKIARPGYTTMM